MPTNDLKKSQIDIVSRQSGLGSLSSAITNTFYGINHRGLGNPVPQNTDQHGLTFFTRPRLNLSYDNIAGVRKMTPLLTSNQMTIQRAIRVLLDPVGASRGITCPFIDNNSAFIPMLTNHLLSCSGWPDQTLDTYTSTPGVTQEAWSMVDGVADFRGVFSLSASFRNMQGDPITSLFYYWEQYMARVYAGTMLPYPEMIVEHEIDYQTRIYRIVLDPTRQKVQKIAACGAAFPISNSLGAAFNFAAEQPFVTENAQLSIQFQAIGVDYLDPRTIQEFNDVVVLFNPKMRDGQRDRSYTRLEAHERNYFNYSGYPRIDPISFDLEWWIDTGDYKAQKTNLPSNPFVENPTSTLLL